MSEKIRVWDLPVRVFHWRLASSFAVAYLVGESDSLRNLHVVLGYTATGLILFRVVWGFVGSQFARFSSFAFSPGAAIGYLRSLAAARAGTVQVISVAIIHPGASAETHTEDVLEFRKGPNGRFAHHVT